VARFFELTRGHVLLGRPRHGRLDPALRLRGPHDRRAVLDRRSRGDAAPLQRRVVFIGGGPPVWSAYARFVRHWDITRLPYDGEADRWFDPLG
jgi:dihydromethanopterin reductase